MLKVGDRVTLKHQPGRWLIVTKVTNEDDIAILRFDALASDGTRHTGLSVGNIDEHVPI